MNLVPTVIEKNSHGERVYDIYSRLLKDRIIIISGEIDDASSNTVVAELLYLDSINHNDINIYINSPGGSVTAGMAIYDTMNFIESSGLIHGPPELDQPGQLCTPMESPSRLASAPACRMSSRHRGVIIWASGTLGIFP